jgi:hypothetical protein
MVSEGKNLIIAEVAISSIWTDEGAYALGNGFDFLGGNVAIVLSNGYMIDW